MKSKLLVLFTLMLVATANTWAQRTDFGTLVTSNTSGTITNLSINWTNGGTIMANDTPLNNGTTTSISIPADQKIILYTTDGAELTGLTCNYGGLKSIDLSNCTTLTSLNCMYNSVTELNLGGCTALTSLNCSYNAITNLNLENCVSLGSWFGGFQQIQVTMLLSETSFPNPISHKSKVGAEKISISGYGSYGYGEDIPIGKDITSISFFHSGSGSGLNGTITITRPGIPSILSMTAKAGETVNLNAKWINGGVIWANDVQLINQGTTTIQAPSDGKITLYTAGGAELTELDCSDSQLTGLNVSGCTTLEKLNCSNNSLAELDITGCINLGNLYADGQAVEVKVLHNGTSFVNPISYKNKIGVEQIIIGTGNNSYAKGAELAISTNTTSIGFRSTNINGSPFSGTINIKRTTTTVFGTLTMYDTSGTTSISSVTWTNGGTILANGVPLPSNSIPIIDGEVILYTIDEAELTGLTYIYGSGLKAIDLSNCTTLESLTCGYNSVTKLNLEGCIALNSLNSTGSRIAELNLTGCVSLGSFSIGNQVVTGSTILLGENTFSNPISYKNKAGVAEEIIIGNRNDSYAKGAEVPVGVNVTSVDFKTATGNFSGTISITRPVLTPIISMTAKVGETVNINAKWINGGGILANGVLLTNESSTSIVVPADGKITLYTAEGAELTELNCANNQLISLDASNCTTLKKLDCANNKLAELNISGCTGLESLQAGGQAVEYEVLSGETTFANPILYKNTTGEEKVIIGNGNDSYAKAEEIPVNESITSLNFSSTSSSFSGTIHFTYTARTILAAMTNRATGTVTIAVKWENEGTIMANRTPLIKDGSNVSVPVSADGSVIIYTTNGAELTELNCRLNQLTALDVSNNPALVSLICDHNNLTTLNIAGCTNLKRLSASNQTITVMVQIGRASCRERG